MLLVAAAVVAAFASTFAILRWPECIVLTLLVLLLFGRKLPELARWLGYKLAGGR